MSKVSDCCGVPAYSNGDSSTEDYGICPECKEHCEYIEELDAIPILPAQEGKEEKGEDYKEIDGVTYIRRDVVENRLMIGFVKKMMDDGKINIVPGQENYFKTIKGEPTDLFLPHLSTPSPSASNSNKIVQEQEDVKYKILTHIKVALIVKEQTVKPTHTIANDLYENIMVILKQHFTITKKEGI